MDSSCLHISPGFQERITWEATHILFKGSIYKVQMLRKGNSASWSSKKPQGSTQCSANCPSLYCFPISSESVRHLEGERYGRIEGGRFPFRTAPSHDEFVPWTISTALLCCSEPWVMHGAGRLEEGSGWRGLHRRRACSSPDDWAWKFCITFQRANFLSAQENFLLKAYT